MIRISSRIFVVASLAIVILPLGRDIASAASASFTGCGYSCDHTVITKAHGDGDKFIIAQALRLTRGAGKPAYVASGSGGQSRMIYRVINNCSGLTCGQTMHRDQCTAADPSTHNRVVQVADPATPTDFHQIDTTCVGKGAAAADGAPLMADLAKLLDTLKPPPAVFHVEPAYHQTLVQIPTLMYADRQKPFDKSTVVDGLPVKVHATIKTWTWIVDGTAAMTTDNPGGGYDGVDPREDPGYYISHTFTHHGKHSIGLRTTWTSTATQADGSPLPLQGTASATSPVYDVTALQARAQLESGTGDNGS